MKINPKIIIRNFDGKKYYEIKYYDTDLKDTVIGYGSYNREYVEHWLQKDFDPVRLEQEKDFEAMAKATENYLQKWGHPHMTIIARLDGIEVAEGIKAKPFVVLD